MSTAEIWGLVALWSANSLGVMAILWRSARFWKREAERQEERATYWFEDSERQFAALQRVRESR